MADRFEQLKTKYQSVLNFMQSQGVQVQNLNMEGDRLFIRASAPSAELKNRVWDQIKLVDPTFSDLLADIQAPAAAAAAVGGAASTTAARTYTVQPGDSLSKISKQFYGDANKYMNIFNANKDKCRTPTRLGSAQSCGSRSFCDQRSLDPPGRASEMFQSYKEKRYELDRQVGRLIEAIYVWGSCGSTCPRRPRTLRSGCAGRSSKRHC